MTHASLFSGIGGFDLAAEWMGWHNVFSCEKDVAARAVLNLNFPHVTHYDDIYNLDATEHKGQVDIITGGFPCQPFSLAGKRRGTDDNRHLWPQMLRVIREVQPSYVVGENVFGLTNMEDGKTFDEIWTSLEDEGYTVEPFILPACAVQAWHRRDRIWIIAYNDQIRLQAKRTKQQPEGPQQYRGLGRQNYDTNTTDTRIKGLRQRKVKADNTGRAQQASAHGDDRLCNQQKQKLCTRREAKGNDTNPKKSNEPRECIERPREGQYRGLGSEQDPAYTNSNRLEGDGQCRANQRWQSTQGHFGSSGRTWTDWTTEPRVGRVAYGVSSRVDRLKQLGNAIVPQVAYEIFKAIEAIQ